MGFRLLFHDPNVSEAGHRVYRSTTSMAGMLPAELPPPVAELGPDIREWQDGAVTPGTTYYYRVSAYTENGVELVGAELEVEATQNDLDDVVVQTLFGGGLAPGALWVPRPIILGQQVLFQDAAGTIPVTQDGEPVGLMKDISGGDYHASQPNDTYRPIYRKRGARHWLESKEGFMFMDTTFANTQQGITMVAAHKAYVGSEVVGGVISADWGGTTTQGRIYFAWEHEASSDSRFYFGIGNYRIFVNDLIRPEPTVTSMVNGSEGVELRVNGARSGFLDGQRTVRTGGAFSLFKDSDNDPGSNDLWGEFHGGLVLDRIASQDELYLVEHFFTCLLETDLEQPGSRTPDIQYEGD